MDKEKYDIALRILKSIAVLNGLYDDMADLVGDWEDLGKEIDVLGDLVFDMIGIPPDETIKNPDGFCRDYCYMVLIDLVDPEKAENALQKLIEIVK